MPSTSKPKAGPTVAYSYIRFSSSAQAEGDSLRRQTERAAEFCQQRGWVLDQTLSLRDLGVSAFKGKNAAVGNLRTFLDAVKEGKVAPGSVLLVESFDRISRQGIDEGYDLVKSILKADVRIVTLSPEREFDRDATKSLSRGALEIQLILERAAEESERKSDRVGQAWKKKREQAQSGVVLTRACPAWMKVEGKGSAAKYVLIPERAAAVKRIFALATDGMGARAIRKKLIADKVPAFRKTWSLSYIKLLLKSRQTFGEFTPRERGNGGSSLQRKAVGPPIPNYYPAAITEKDFYAAQTAVESRQGKGSRPGKEFVNVFSALLHDARTRSRMHIMQYRRDGKMTRYLAPYESRQGGKHVGFPLDVFEAAVLDYLDGVKPHDVLPSANSPAKESAALEGKEKDIKGRLARLKTRLKTEDEADTIMDAIRELTDELKEVQAEVSQAKQREAAPAEGAWEEFATVTATLASAKDINAARTRLRAVLRRMVESVWCLFMPGTGARVAWVQVVFAGGEKFQHFAIVFRPRHGLPGGKEYPPDITVQDLTTEMKAGDLRNEKNARDLEAALAAVDPATWAKVVPHRNQRLKASEAYAKKQAMSKARAAKWRAMRDQGKSYAEIAAAEQPPVSTNTVHYMLNGRKGTKN